MPLWLVQIIIVILQKTGLVNWAEAMAVKAGIAVVDGVKNLTTEDTYPTGVNGASDNPLVSVSNINKE